jgi:KaiC/GvpD/RAD55 family RecA-like ATPase
MLNLDKNLNMGASLDPLDKETNEIRGNNLKANDIIPKNKPLCMSFAPVITEKTATFGFKEYATDNVVEFIEILNTKASIPVELSDGHRRNSSVTKIYDWIRFDIDDIGEAEKLEKAISNLWYIKKPSTNHKTSPYKWHYLIRVSGAMQHPQQYKLQVAEFMDRFDIPKLKDLKVTKTCVQNLNPCREDLKYCNEHTKLNEGEIVELIHIDEEFTPLKEGNYIDGILEGVKKADKVGLNSLKIKPINDFTGEFQTPILARNGFIQSKSGCLSYTELESYLRTQPKDTIYQSLACPMCNSDHTDGKGGVGYAFAYISNNEREQMIVNCTGSACKDHPLYILDDEMKDVKQDNPFKNGKTPLDLLKDFKMTKSIANKYKNLDYLYDGLIVRGYHHYLYGPAGAGKTTTAYFLTKEMAKKYKDLQFIFFYLDGALTMASNMLDDINESDLDNIHILSEGSSSEVNEIMETYRKHQQKLDDYVFIYDTFKFLTKDVNNKNENKKAMHLIKDLNRLGATFLSLGHTNKDGKKQSGTADIEQDSDALLRIDSQERDGGLILTSIKKGGRCRMEVKETTFEYVAGDPTTIEVYNEFIPIEEEKKEQELINEIKRILETKPKMLQREIEDKVTLCGRNKLIKILKSNNRVGYWKIEKGEKNSNVYSLWKHPLIEGLNN